MHTSIKLATLLPLLAALSACSGGGSDTSIESDNETDDTTSSAAFPSGLAVASPMESTSEATASFGDHAAAASLGSSISVTSAYSWATLRVNALLSGDTPVRDAFQPELFYVEANNANCYGPKLYYQNHIDGSDGSAMGSDLYPSLPTGDLGLWSVTEDGSEACAAAQLNARMQGVRDNSLMSLMSLASMISVYQDAGHSWPTDITAGASADITSEMNLAGITDVTFNSASIALDVGATTWTYNLDMTYDRSGTPYNIKVKLAHVPGASSDQYEGLLTYQVDDDTLTPGNCSSSEMTRVGSLHYVRNALEDMRLQSRYGEFCGYGADGLTEAVNSSVVTGNVLNPSENWANDFSIFTADYDPTSLVGDYSFAWQAGRGDSNSRVLDIGLETASAGETYFGYGDTIDATDGSITGFICNWAGPGGSHSLSQYAQRQHVTLDSSTGIWEPTNDAASNITYAPTNSCTYDGSGAFLYDRDLDGDLNDETVDTAAVGSGLVLNFDLMTPSGSAVTIWDHITTNRGYDVPNYPN